MTGTLSFDLSKPDERQAHMRAVRADDLAFLLSDILEWAHRHMKDNEPYRDPVLMFTDLRAHYGDRNINIDELCD